ncbi:MAG TPA: hypothetical protein VJX10_00170 [Pseudonocardiaceae bacterium]|nr:hypothetical protein [Pseudonocardiaceae bacterium]
MDPDRMVFLIVGVVVVVIVGRLMVHSGRRYVASGSGRRGAASGANLVAVLFHLATLGVVALIAVLPLGGAANDRLLLRIGILLLILAAVYGITLALLSRRREQAMVAEFDAPPPQRVDSEITYGVPPEHRIPPRTESTPDRTRLR